MRIVEVLSSTTSIVDRGAKLAALRKLLRMREYAHIAPKRLRR